MGIRIKLAYESRAKSQKRRQQRLFIKQHRQAYRAYKILLRYCAARSETCEGCLFDDKKLKCGCIANIPTEWNEPNIMKAMIKEV